VDKQFQKERQDALIKERKEFWEQFFNRRNWSHQHLAKRLDVDNATISHWLSGETSISPENFSKLLKDLSQREANQLVRLCLEGLGFPKESFTSIATAIAGMPISRDRLTTHTHLRSSDFPRLIAEAQDQIDILQTYIPNIEAMDDTLPSALKNGCKIRILVLKLDSDYLNARLTHLDSDKSAMSHSLNRLKKVAQASKSSKGTIQIKAYDFLCYFPYHRIDNLIFTGFYLREGSSRYPQIGMSVDEVTQIFPDLLQHFEEYWNRQDNELIASNRDPEH